MPILDCENIDSLYNSIERITTLNKQNIDCFMKSFDLYKFFEQNTQFNSAEQVFPYCLKKEMKINFDYTGSYWFHIAHYKRTLNFEEGLLPLNLALDKIWDFLFSLVSGVISKQEWEATRTSIETNYDGNFHASLYRMKFKDSFHWGPYGFLAKDLPCFEDSFAKWHYFNGPEIVVDICECVTEIHGFNLLKSYKENTSPCIVKFLHYDKDISNLGHALFFLYKTLKKESLSFDSNICFSTRGKIINADKIIKIEFWNNNT